MININLIAERRARKIQEMSILRWAMMGVALLLLCMLALNFMEWRMVDANRRQVEEVQGALKELDQKRTVLLEIVDEIRVKQPIVALLEQVRVSEAAWMTILCDISRIIPDDAVVNTMTTSANREGVNLRLVGRAKDTKTVGAFMEAFSRQTRWANIAKLGPVNSESNAEEGNATVRFDVTVPVRGLMGGDF